MTGAIGPQYYVHYEGWKETQDEWVPAERLLPQNLRLKAAHPHRGRGPGQAGSGQVKSGGGPGISVKKKGSKRRQEQVIKLAYRWCSFLADFASLT